MAYDLNVPLFAALCRKGGKTAREGASESLDGWNKVSCMEGAGKVLPESFVSCDRKECFLETVMEKIGSFVCTSIITAM